jgi:uncharacterized protein (TIGR03118 family)
MLKRACSLLFIVPLLLLTTPALSSAGPNANAYGVAKLVSDVPGMANHLDRRLVNAWGLSAGPATPWWVADNGTNRSTLYDGTGGAIPLVVRVGGGPTGTVFNGGSGFVVHNGGSSGPSLFLFDTEAGTIRGWNPGVPGPGTSTRAFTVVNRHGKGAIYKGLAIASTPAGEMLYATDFHNARVDVFDAQFHQVLQGAFNDPSIPAHFAPFGIQELGGNIFVTYAMQDADAEDDVSGSGLGYVDMFSADGTLLGRVASRGALNAPWGLAWAPDDFGRFSGDLLVGNFGDGRINAYAWDGSAFSHDGVLRRPGGDPVWIDGLWAIAFGNGGPAGATNSLFFTAGPQDESHGLFGRIDAKH